MSRSSSNMSGRPCHNVRSRCSSAGASSEFPARRVPVSRALPRDATLQRCVQTERVCTSGGSIGEGKALWNLGHDPTCTPPCIEQILGFELNSTSVKPGDPRCSVGDLTSFYAALIPLVIRLLLAIPRIPSENVLTCAIAAQTEYARVICHGHVSKR